ncbi:MAG: hypothetical protein JSS02_27560 [Planctomycetes bacterium]|nr:hypothetical protein [Planctomycetota bacterium]
MARLRRGEVFSPSEIAIVHVMNRIVHRYFLFGDDCCGWAAESRRK